MFMNMDMNEAKFGEYKIKDFNVAGHYGYIDNEGIQEKKSVNINRQKEHLGM